MTALPLEGASPEAQPAASVATSTKAARAHDRDVVGIAMLPRASWSDDIGRFYLVSWA